jgi:hypothetical protein
MIQHVLLELVKHQATTPTNHIYYYASNIEPIVVLTNKKVFVSISYKKGKGEEGRMKPRMECRWKREPRRKEEKRREARSRIRWKQECRDKNKKRREANIKLCLLPK